MRDAARALGRWRLDDCTLVVTLEPCVMCAGAVVNARLGQLVYGATDPKAGAVGSLYDVPADTRLNHRPPVVSGILATECGELLRASSPNAGDRPKPRPVASPTGRMPERTNGTASKAVEVLRASVGSNPTPSAIDVRGCGGQSGQLVGAAGFDAGPLGDGASLGTPDLRVLGVTPGLGPAVG